MSSYLCFYLVPKKMRKHSTYVEEKGYVETEEKLTEGKPILFLSFSRNSDVYQEYNEVLNPAYRGNEQKYTELTHEDSKKVVDSMKQEIENTEKSLEISYKMLKEGGYSSEMWEEIHSTERYLVEQKDSLKTLEQLSYFVYESTNGNNEFEKVLISID